MKQYALLIIFFSCMVTWTAAQTIEDAIRYSNRNRIGTARGYGAGSSLGAIGGDFGSAASNPAGMAMFKRSEFQISPAVFFGPTTSVLTGGASEEVDASRTRFMWPSASYVQVNRIQQRMQSDENGRQPRYGWTRTSWGVGINRVANFNRQFEYDGAEDHSITQMFIEQGGTDDPDFLNAFITGPAYDAFITTYNTTSGTYEADIEATDIVTKSQTVSQKGGIDELSIAFGADYANKLQLGASINFPIFRFKEKKKYKEVANGHPIFNGLEFDENLNIKGSGLNIKLGAKYIVAKKVHLSAAFHTPTWIAFTEEYDTRASYDYTFSELFPSPGPTNEASPLGEFEYSFRSPWRATGGIGVIIGKIGFISSEVEYVNYASSKFTIVDDPGYENQLNEQIDFELGSTLALRLGAEIRIKDFRVRGGVGFGESVYEIESGLKNNSFSLGFGYWIDNVFIDVGYRHESIDQRYSPYTLSGGPSPIVNSSINENNLVVTFGVKI